MKSLAVSVPAARLAPGLLLAIGLANANGAGSVLQSRPVRSGRRLPLLRLTLALLGLGAVGLYMLR
ncbi:hypothetical protein LPC08_16485 [Roseomonas sp. OT10]|uniref:hypothetical protein n=1 Tax=Roseomonas cutis TaxID=2897332 RepID=UPI001E4BADD8|nr:hypothetical protein [Roseomonas sp. OT10]UFN47604.1 hypothetical protein LPC08_16485 [Roseomonas sp. OT10]